MDSLEAGKKRKILAIGTIAQSTSSTVLNRFLFEREGEAPAELSQEFNSAGASPSR